MTSSLLADRRVGSQVPRVRRVPAFDYSEGPRAIAAAERARLFLDPWQRSVLVDGLGVAPDGDWTAKKADCWVPRQNGKGGIIEALELYWLFGTDVVCPGCDWRQMIGLPRCLRCRAEVPISLDAVISHTAHRQDTADTAYARLAPLIKLTPEYHARVQIYRETNGKERIELKDGRALEYKTRGRGGGRGDSVPKKIYDEAQELTADQVGDADPTTSAMEFSQTWYFGTPPKDPTAWCYALREDGEKGLPDHAHWDWGLDVDLDDEDQRVAALSLDAAYRSNPAMGTRIRESTVLREQRPSSLGEMYFAERLGVWPKRIAVAGDMVTSEAWAALLDVSSQVPDDAPRVFCVEVAADRSRASITVYAGRGEGRLEHAELVDYRPGTAWVAQRAGELDGKWRPALWVLDPHSEAGSLLGDLKDVGIEAPEKAEWLAHGGLFLPSSGEYAQACGQMLDAVRDRDFVHIGQEDLRLSAVGARKKSIGGASGVDRVRSLGDAGPFAGVSLARWAYRWKRPEEGGPGCW